MIRKSKADNAREQEQKICKCKHSGASKKAESKQTIKVIDCGGRGRGGISLFDRER